MVTAVQWRTMVTAVQKRIMVTAVQENYGNCSSRELW